MSSPHRTSIVPLLALVLALAPGSPGLAAAPPRASGVAPEVGRALRSDLSPPLRDLARCTVPPGAAGAMDRQGPRHGGPDLERRSRRPPEWPRSVQRAERPFPGLAMTPPPIAVWQGTTADDDADLLGSRVVPPDTEGDVGLDHYCQWTNQVLECFDKETGVSTLGPLPGNTPWVGFGGICETNNDGDPIVLFDHLADRWLLSQFAVGADGHQCVAISQTSDPAGPYFRWDFLVSTGAVNDYPKFGVWPDGYYLTINEVGFNEAQALVFERERMLTGEPDPRFAKFRVEGQGGEFYFSLQPSHLEGPPPPPGTCNTFVMAFDTETWGVDGEPDGYRLWDFCVDWAGDSWSFDRLPDIESSVEFDASLCNFFVCIPQPDGGELLSTFSSFTMYRAQYRFFDPRQSTIEATVPGAASWGRMVVNHTVDAGGDRAGVRWAELRRGRHGWFLHQDGTYAPGDGLHRWMGSIAMDAVGNLALGYSVSSAAVFPSIRYTSRRPGDPRGTMAGGEVELQAGTGAQVDSSSRWGDYSTMSIDPVDGCTFFFTSEYYEETGSFDWATAIGKFRFDDCVNEPAPARTRRPGARRP